MHKIFSDGKIPGFVHLYVGEEAVATGVMSQLEDDDYITSTIVVMAMPSRKAVI